MLVRVKVQNANSLFAFRSPAACGQNIDVFEAARSRLIACEERERTRPRCGID